MADTYGGGLDLQSVGGLAQAELGNLDNSGTLPAASGAPAPTPAQAPMPPPQQQAPASPQFGSSLKSLLPGPQYDAPDPQTSALDQSASLLKQRIDRASSIAANPLAQFFAPEQAAAAREAVPKMTEQLQQIKGQQQQAVDIKQTARNWGLTNPNQFGEQATDTTLANEALRQWKDEGNFNAYKALSGLSPEWANRANLYMPDAMSKFGTHVAAVQTGIQALNAAASTSSEQAYQAARDKVIKDNDLSALGIKVSSIPATLNDWMANRGSLEAQYNGAARTLNSFRARQDQLNQAVPISDAKVAGQIEGTYQFGNGEAIPGAKAVSLPGYGDVQGAMLPPGSRDTTQYGKTWSAASPEQVKTVRDQLGAEEVKGALSKYKIAREFNDTAHNDKMYTSAAGNALIADELGAIGRDVAEGSKAAGTVGLTKMLEAKYGTLDVARNRLNTELSAFQSWVSKGGDANPRLSRPSIEGIKAVAQFKHDEALKEAQDRISQPLETAGRYGMKPENIGIDKELLNSPLASTYSNALRDAKNTIDSYPMVTIGDRRVMLPTGSNVPGAKVLPLDHSGQSGQTPDVTSKPTSPAPSQPSATGGAGQPPNPQQQGPAAVGQPPAAPPSPQQPSGGGTPFTVAGQQVAMALPPGASPTYVNSLQRIETGNSRNPWTAGAPGTSAGGAYQFVKSTWDANKPPGAPDRAADATPAQQTAALEKLTATNASALQTAGLPVNDTNLYVAHNLGPTGGAALLKANPNADARTVVGETAARNNPTFFKGRPTVATVLGRYQANVAQDISDTVPRAPAPPPGAAAPNQPGNPMDDPAAIAWNQLTPAQQEQGRKGGVDMLAGAAPAAASTVGALAGGALGGPLGAVAGGAAGGGAGQALGDYLRGNAQSPAKMAEQAALGGVLGVASEARPLLSAAGRVVGTGAIEAGTEAAKGGDTADVLGAGARGAAEGLGGEALGRFVSSAGATAYKALSRYTTSAQSELSAQAGKLAAAREILKTEQPKLAGDAGANPKYEAAQKQADDATAAIKDHGQNPDDMVHAYEQATSGVSAGEAAVMRKAQSEKTATSQGYNQLRQDVRDTGVGVPKANQPVPDGPLAQIRTASNPTGAVEAKFAPDAEHAEMLIKAPAKDWGEKWQQLQNAGTELIQKRMSFLQNGDKPSADAMDAIFKGVRNQQKAAASYVFGAEKGKQVIAQLEDLDQRYAKVMNATQGMNYGKMRSVIQAGNTPERRALEKNFTAFAGDDPSAMRAFNAMKAGAKGRLTDEAKLMVPLITAESLAHLGGVPTLGVVSAVVGGHRLYKVMQEYANAKVLGRPVTFQDFFNREIRSGAGQVAASAVRRATVQGNMSPPLGALDALR